MDRQEPTKKMSKSFGTDQGKVLLLDEPDVGVRTIKRAVADSEREVRHDPESKPGISNLIELMTVATGETIALFAPFRPSFVLAGKRLKEPALRAAAARWKCVLSRGEGIDFFSGRTIPAWTFIVASPALLGPSVRKAESAFGPEWTCSVTSYAS